MGGWSAVALPRVSRENIEAVLTARGRVVVGRCPRDRDDDTDPQRPRRGGRGAAGRDVA